MDLNPISPKQQQSTKPVCGRTGSGRHLGGDTVGTQAAPGTSIVDAGGPGPAAAASGWTKQERKSPPQTLTDPG